MTYSAKKSPLVACTRGILGLHFLASAAPLRPLLSDPCAPYKLLILTYRLCSIHTGVLSTRRNPGGMPSPRYIPLFHPSVCRSIGHKDHQGRPRLRLPRLLVELCRLWIFLLGASPLLALLSWAPVVLWKRLLMSHRGSHRTLKTMEREVMQPSQATPLPCVGEE